MNRLIKRRQGGRGGYSLLEVVLALAILAVSVAILGELSGQAVRSARQARDLSYAHLICESKLAEIAAGAVAASPVRDAVDDYNPDWLYSIDIETAQLGLVGIRVTVRRSGPAQKHPAEFSMVRWIADPDAQPVEPATETTQEQSNSTSSSTGGS